jgi:hypothetical protein
MNSSNEDNIKMEMAQMDIKMEMKNAQILGLAGGPTSAFNRNRLFIIKDDKKMQAEALRIEVNRKLYLKKEEPVT